MVISALSSMVLTGLVAWFTWGMRAVNRDDMGVLLAPDRQVVADLRSAVQDLTVQVREHGQDLARFSAIIQRLEARENLRGTP